MQDFLEQCSELSEYVQRFPKHSKAHQWFKKDSELRQRSKKIQDTLHCWIDAYQPAMPAHPADSSTTLKAIAYNIERGKHLASLIAVLRSSPQLNDADFYFLTEVDWGMARTDNQNVAGEIGKALGLYAYFAPSYFNLTKGHGTERQLPGKNTLGLHGKALLSRYPLKNLRVLRMPNATDKLRSKESRLGEKRALCGDLVRHGKTLTLVCTHLDAFSSPQDRANQLEVAARTTKDNPHVLLAGDWNTNTMNTCSGRHLITSVLRQITLTGPQNMIRHHFPFPERKFDRPLFQMLNHHGFQFEDFNEMGTGTFDLFTNDQELGKMAHDQYPLWLLRWINRLVEKSGGLVSLKLDWFAAKGLQALSPRVVKLKSKQDFDPAARPSDHHPILLEFQL